VGEAYDQHHQAIRAFATRLVGDAELAEDLVQEAFVALPRAIGRFRGDSSLRSFVSGVVVNHARHFVRSASRRRATLQRLAKEPTTSPERPDLAAENHAFLEALQRAMDALPLDQRVAFVVCEVEGRTAAEASLIAGAPEATMRTRLFHAKKKLQSALEAEGFR
jgi:RNA polymerase sigma-70 factor (ECF subfamily)